MTFTNIGQAENEGWQYVDLGEGVSGFFFRRGNVRFNAWLGGDGRWHGHRKASGRVTEDFNYASRRSMLRSVLRRIARED